jgi:hypothetical protein
MYVTNLTPGSECNPSGGPVGRVWLKHRIPHGLHGAFVPGRGGGGGGGGGGGSNAGGGGGGAAASAR